MKSVAFHNLGCKVNSYEMEVMQQILQSCGYEIVQFTQKADVYIVNTCTVTNMADRKSRQMLHRAKQLNPEAVVVAAGCYAQTGLADLKKDLSVDIIVGNNHKTEIADILEEYFKGKGENETCGQFENVSNLDAPTDYENAKLYDKAERTRVDIKVQDGCNQFCSYCAIPLARGRVRSRKPEDVIDEIKTLVSNGHLEVVLTGIHISSYGIDFDDKAWENGEIKPSTHESEKSGEMMRDYRGESKLIDLIEMIAALPENQKPKRIRLGSFEPRILTQETCEKLASIKEICPHFHISLQSGCDETLKRMNRHYTAKEYEEAVNNLRQAYAKIGRRVAITTDVIVGFPGETESEFEQTREYLERINLYEMHIFKFSRRKGTVADKMKEQVPESAKEIRSNILLDMTAHQSENYRKNCVGQVAEVLFEEEKNGMLIGHSDDYLKIGVKVSDKDKTSIGPGALCEIRIGQVLDGDLMIGELV